ncbi:hypothetical protein [Shinella sp.]|uniref:hypothetical protein n=1 Tax=Shinella sp. TaxID=1870904 RepID=UPI003F6E7C60
MPIGHKLEESPNPTEHLLKALQGFKRELVAVEHRRREIRNKIADLNRILGNIDGQQADDDFDGEDDANDEERDSDSKEIRTATRNAIERLGRPVKRADILKELKRTGIVLSAKDPGRAVNRTLYRSQEVFGRVKEGYVLQKDATEKD